MKAKKIILCIFILLSLVGCNPPRNENAVTCATTDNALYGALGTPEGCE